MRRSFEKLFEQIISLVVPQKWIEWHKENNGENNKEPLNGKDIRNISIVIGMILIIFFLFSY